MEGKKTNMNDRRGTGRTTRTLLRALKEGRVDARAVIVTATEGIARNIRNMREYNPNVVEALSDHRAAERLQGRRGSVLFEHTAVEAREFRTRGALDVWRRSIREGSHGDIVSRLRVHVDECLAGEAYALAHSREDER